MGLHVGNKFIIHKKCGGGGGMDASIIILIHQKTHGKSVVNDISLYGGTPKDLLVFTRLLRWSGRSSVVFPSGSLVAVG
jgi:hypothetical protein